MKEEIKFLSDNEIKNIPQKRISSNSDTNPMIIEGFVIEGKIQWDAKGTVYQNRSITPLKFFGCVFNETVVIGNNQPEGKIFFEECIFNSNVNVHAANISFVRSQFLSDLTIKANQYNDTTLKGYDVKGSFTIAGSTNKLFIKDVNNTQNTDGRKIFIAATCNDLLINNVLVDDLFFQHTMEVTNEISVEGVKAHTINIGKIACNKTLKIRNCRTDEIHIDKIRGSSALEIFASDVGMVNFRTSNLIKMSIVNCILQTLIIFDANDKESILNIEKSQIASLQFNRLFNNGLMTLREITIPREGIVSFKSSNLGKADFIYCDFSKATLEFENSKITEAFLSESEFPTRVLVDNKINYAQEQLAFGQLATAFQKQGDSIRAAEYSSRELEAHYYSIRWLSKDFFEKLNLALNKLSNNFGRSWIKGTIFSFSVGLALFCLLLISTNQYRWGVPTLDLTILPAYLKFMNPLRFYELESLFVGTAKQGSLILNGFSYLADFAGRVFVTYGYYQTIQAFRRFGRK